MSQPSHTERSARRHAGATATFAAFVATVWVANLVVEHFGVVDVGFGLQGPAAVYVVGVAFTLRDLLHRIAGPYVVMAAIVVGAALSLLIAPAFAVASGVAFLVSELVDLLVYTPLQRRSWLGAIALSNTVGLAVDSLLFLWLAFGSLAFFWGQCVGKSWMTLIAVLLLAAARYGRALLPRYA
jgi:uncharacterized PurR-regulated membrane protein YhhQ (DUF165 family)